jgi:hypothetical protein
VAATAGTDPTVRLQDHPLENGSSNPQRRSFFARIGAFFGL